MIYELEKMQLDAAAKAYPRTRIHITSLWGNDYPDERWLGFQPLDWDGHTDVQLYAKVTHAPPRIRSQLVGRSR